MTIVAGSAAGPDDPAAEPSGAAAVRLADAIVADSWDVVDEIISGRWPELVFGGHQEVVRQAVGRFPFDRVRSSSVLGFFGELAGFLPPQTVELPLQVRDHELRRLGRSSEAGAALRSSAIAIAARRSQGHYDDAVDLARRGRIVAEAAEWAVAPEVDQLIPLWYLHAGLAAQLGGDFALARSLHRSAHRRRARTPYDFVAADAAGNLAMLDAFEGNLSEARAWVDRATAEPTSTSWISHFVPTARQVAVSVIATDRLDRSALARAQVELLAAVDLDEQWPNIIWARTHATLLFGDPVGLSNAIRNDARAHEHRIGRTGWAHEVVAVSQAELALSAGHSYQAKAALDGLASVAPHVVVARARLALATGNPRQAKELLSTAIATDHASARIRAQQSLLVAEIRHRLDDHGGARDALRQTLRIAAPHASFAVFATASRDVLEHHAPYVARLRDVLRALDAAGVGEVYPACPSMIELTPREMVVLEHLATDATMPQIAAKLFVSPNTIKTQARTLYRKYEVGTRAAAVDAARRTGVLP